MSPGANAVSPKRLHLVRLAGERGSILRCAGALTAATCEALRRGLDLLAALEEPLLVVNLSGCDRLDLDGVIVLLEALRRRRAEGRRLALVAREGPIAALLRRLRVDRLAPLAATEAEAAKGSEPAVAATGRAEAVAFWRRLEAAVREDRLPPPLAGVVLGEDAGFAAARVARVLRLLESLPGEDT